MHEKVMDDKTVKEAYDSLKNLICKITGILKLIISRMRKEDTVDWLIQYLLSKNANVLLFN